MRICMLAGNPLSFDGRVLRHAASLARAGHEVTLLGVIGPNDEKTPPPSLPGVRVLRIDRRRAAILPRLVWLLSAARRRLSGSIVAALERHEKTAPRLFSELLVAPCAVELFLLALSVDADAYHGNDLDTLVPAAWAARVRGRSYVYDAHELYADESPLLSASERKARRDVEAALMSGALATITVSDLLADELVRRYGAPRPVVLRNLPALCPRPPRRNSTAAAIQRPLRLLLHGAWVGLEQPGVETALLAVQRTPGAILTLRGGVRDEAALQSRIAALGLCSRVRRAPRLPGAEALVAAAIAEEHDIGLSVHLPDCASRSLATSSKVFEYLMAGLAVVAADLPGNRHIFELSSAVRPDRAVGLLYAPGDAAALAEALGALHKDRASLSAMQETARDVAEKALCWEQEQPRLLGIYRQKRS
jgi:glycosyltransferase involved in cell wall biosynthesis